MLLRHLEDAVGLFSSVRGSLVGVGMTAYSRFIPSYLCRPYHIVALRKTRDLPALRRRAEIFCLEEEIGRSVRESDFNSTSLLSHPLTQGYLQKLPDPKYLLLYQSYPELEDLAGREGWNLLANPARMRLEVGERGFFRALIEELCLNRIPGDMVPIGEMWSRGYRHWAGKLGTKLAIQLPEVRQGGGKGTFFISSEPGFRALRERLGRGIWRGSRLETASIRTFIEGTPASLALCVTKRGILVSGLQRQLIDLSYTWGLPENGVFCGHSWGEPSWPLAVSEEALSQASTIGGFLMRRGYRGILGIDLIIDRVDGRVYPVELNPRFTGAFPMLSQLHMQRGLIPLDAFHIMEFMGLSHETEILALNAGYREPVRGGHLILFLMAGGKSARVPGLRGGLYESAAEGGNARYLGEAVDYDEIRNERQFIITDGPPDGEVGSDDPLYRLCRLLFACPLTEPDGGVSGSALRTAEWVHRMILE
ncbi:MAG: ATP-grasp domain-containing protein [Deltaproteobacteria bacterium]|nr:ATP-grasp domain-containing protein [Deltaproteobacteria bacterium]